MHAFAALLNGEAPPVCTPEELCAMAFVLAENAERIAERQQLEAAQRWVPPKTAVRAA